MPEVEARSAQNVLEACAQTDTMLKVIFTSSVTAVLWRDDLSSNHLNERHWSNVDFCNKFKLWHALSKTVAEKAAWALAMDRDVVNMVSINAGFILGASGLALSNPFLKRIAEMYRNGLLVTVHLDFLVDAHICVFQDVSSYGRYICFDHVVNRHQDALQLAAMLPPPSAPPAGALPTSSTSDWMEPSLHMYDQRIYSGIGRVFDALHLLQIDPSVQRMVISLSSDRAVWDAILNNEAVRELRESYYSDEGTNDSESSDDESNPQTSSTNLLSWIIDNMRSKLMEFLAGITNLIKEAFQAADNEQQTDGFPDGFSDKVRASFMLTAILLLIVVMSRASQA